MGRHMKIFLDTCALVWWTLDPKQLSKKALAEFNRQETIWTSSISLWEIGLKIKNKKLDIGMSIDTYHDRLKEIECLNIVSVDTDIWLKNLALSWAHRDLADRTIVATAKLLECSLATTDRLIQNYYKDIFPL